MKHFKQYLKKIDKTSIKKAGASLVLLFFAMLMLFQKGNTNGELQFVRNSDGGIIHSAPNDNPPPSQRDYLFQNEAGNPEYQGQITKGQDTQIIPPSTTNMNTIDYPDTTAQTNTGVSYTENMITGGLITGSTITGALNTGSLDCITPWNEQVKNQDFVLGYQQREDVNTMCNIEKRICNDGVLGGTFNQASCKEDGVYTYRKAEVVSYNQKVLNEFIQPPAPVNEGAIFDTQGKIDQTEKGATKRGTTNNPVRNIPAQGQDLTPNKLNCKTPRGQTIKHGQFTKAYKSPRGFIDLSCDVEIRACIDGQLKGKYFYPKCTFYNTTSTDYIKAGFPKSNAGLLFFEWIKASLGR